MNHFWNLTAKEISAVTPPNGLKQPTGPALPTEAKARKDIPIYSGFVKYFPLAMAAVAELSRKGNDQHNPGKPLHWDRSKSGDELDALMRHLTDEAAGVPKDTDDVLHLTKVAWRAMAQLQKTLEKAVVPPIRFAGDWNEWKGGNMPVPYDTKVNVKFASGITWSNVNAGQWAWWHSCPLEKSDIIAWRLSDA